MRISDWSSDVCSSDLLGEIDDPGMEIEIAVRKFDVPHEFSDASLQQAAKVPPTVKPSELKGRVDLRDVPFVTIDGEDARDFDDAVFCMPVELGTEKRKKPDRKGVVEGKSGSVRVDFGGAR